MRKNREGREVENPRKCPPLHSPDAHASGENITGERVGDTMDTVVALLRREQVLVTKVTPVKAKAEAGAQKKGKLGKGVPSRTWRSSPVSSR